MFRKLLFAALAFMPGLMPALQGNAEPKLRPEMLVTTGWLAENLSEPDVIVLCINSTPEFYTKGHIPGARQIKLSDIAVTRDGIPNELPPVETLQHVFEAAGVSNSSRVVLYGERLNLFAARAYFTLDYLGVAARVALLDGGLEKWTAERRPLSTEIPQAKTTTLVVSPRPEILVDTKNHARTITKKAGKRDSGGRTANKRIYRRAALRRCGQSRAHSRSERTVLDGHAGQPPESRAEAGSRIAAHVLCGECQSRPAAGYLLPHGNAVFLRLLCGEISWLRSQHV